LQRRFPEAKVFFLVFTENFPIVTALGLAPAERVLQVDTSSFSRLLSTGLRALIKLWRAHIDTVIETDPFSRFSAALAFLICRGNRVGFHRFTVEGLNRGQLLTHPVIYSFATPPQPGFYGADKGA